MIKVIIVLGLPGSGKSFLASRLAKKVNAAYVSSDHVRKKITTLKTYSEIEKKEVYNAMLDILHDSIEHNQNLVLDATFYKEELRDLFLKKCKDLHVHCYIIEVITGLPLINKRLSIKRVDSDADLAIYKKVKGQFEEIKENHLILESKENNIDSMLKKSLNYINNEQGSN